jgi:hypothetical protein
MKDALKNIQQYDPPEAAWDGIALRLSDMNLKRALDKAPIHTPSDDVWERLEAKLEAKSQTRLWLRYSAAACVLIIFSFGMWFLLPSQNEPYVISSKPFQQELSHLEVSKTDQAYQEIQQICQQQKYTCERIDYKTLNEEYLNLKNAETELRVAIGQYNSEPNLIEELNRIEIQKIRLINEMAEKI